MNKPMKGPVSQFLIENLSQITTTHKHVAGRINAIADACSRHPMLGPRRLAPVGLQHSIQLLVEKSPASLRTANIAHASAGLDTPDLARLLQAWRTGPDSIVPTTPTSRLPPAPADLALCLLSDAPFAVLLPVDLAAQATKPNVFPDAPVAELQAAFARAGKITLLHPQMTWVIGNVPGAALVETYGSELQTPDPLSCFASTGDTFEGPVPQTLGDWATAQAEDPRHGRFHRDNPERRPPWQLAHFGRPRPRRRSQDFSAALHSPFEKPWSVPRTRRSFT
jgi:hypothetical protein